MATEEVLPMNTVLAKADHPKRSSESLLHETQKMFFRCVLRNQNYYYGTYFSSNNLPLLILKNILKPRRILTKLAYGQIIPLPIFLSKGDPLPKFTPSQEVLRVLEQLKRDGAVVIPSAFREIADHITAKYDIDLAHSKPFDGYQRDMYLKETDQKILQFMVDEFVLQVFGLYYGRQPYLRAPVGLSICYPPFDQKSTRETDMAIEKLNMGWHYDTPNMLQIAVLLNDVTEADSHMQVAKGDHRIHRANVSRYDYYYSDEYVRDHYEIVQCIGPKGTIYLFDSYALHRLMVYKDRPRAMVKVMYVPGNDIVGSNGTKADSKIVVEGDLCMDALSPLQRNSLRYLM